MTRILDLAGLEGLIASLARRAATRSSDRRCETGRSCTTSSSRPPRCRPAGRMSRTAAAIGSSAARTRRGSATPSGPSSWKRFLLPPRVRLWRTNAELDVEEEPLPERPLAFVGVRPCELAAIAVQDRVLLGGRYADRDYAARREGLFVVAVNCHEPGGTCFCASMGTGPTVSAGYDLALTELARAALPRRGRQPARDGAPRGARRRRAGRGGPAGGRASSADRAVEGMGRSLDTDDIRDLLRASLEHPRWDEVAERCLTCGNCTLVCPTCFCTSVEDANDLAGGADRSRVWDSCFSVDYSYIHGGAIRQSPRARYRQWLTHKLGTWHDQFGSSGCVGCGRCITWCPVGIDITEEVAAIRATGEEDA